MSIPFWSEVNVAMQTVEHLLAIAQAHDLPAADLFAITPQRYSAMQASKEGL